MKLLIETDRQKMYSLSFSSFGKSYQDDEDYATGCACLANVRMGRYNDFIYEIDFNFFPVYSKEDVIKWLNFLTETGLEIRYTIDNNNILNVYFSYKIFNIYNKLIFAVTMFRAICNWYQPEGLHIPQCIFELKQKYPDFDNMQLLQIASYVCYSYPDRTHTLFSTPSILSTSKEIFDKYNSDYTVNDCFYKEKINEDWGTLHDLANENIDELLKIINK